MPENNPTPAERIQNLPPLNETTAYSLKLTPRENAALEVIMHRDLQGDMNISKRQAITLAILGYAKMDSVSDAIRELRVMIQSLGSIATIPSRGPGRPPSAYQPKVKEDPLDRKKMLCEMIEGELVGNSCKFTHYEVTAIGKAYSTSRTFPLMEITEEQAAAFADNKSAWLAAKESKGEMH